MERGTIFFFAWLLLDKWLRELAALEASGRVLCPLMLKELARFPAATCPCDLPLTRSIYLANHRFCHRGTNCLARTRLPEQALQEELHPFSPERSKRARGSWTLFLRQS